MTNLEFAEKAVKIAKNYRTLYVWGGFGAPATAANKTRYLNESNKKRADAIKNARDDTFFFDCSGLVKAILWGWNGNIKKKDGGAIYASNGVPDLGAGEFITRCKNVSTNFNNLITGEFLWMKGHCGIYIGDGLAVEATSKWDSKVQITSCNCDRNGYKRRNWTSHGLLPYITYVKVNEYGFIIPAPLSCNVYNERVKNWQVACINDGYSASKLKVDGYWGKQCENAANKCVVKYRSILGKQINKFCNCTKIVQRAVNTYVDGHCGKKTDEMIRKYQGYVGLETDGSVGPKTIKIMLGVKD